MIYFSYMQPLDFLAIGDITTDAFIRIKNAAVHCNIDRKNCELCVEFGSKIPYEFAKVVPAVGNCANAAVAAARLGLSSALLTNQGDDEIGKEHLRVLAREKVSTDFVKNHIGKVSNYHYVLWYEDERTILVRHEEYPYSMPDIGSPKYVYLTSLGANSIEFHGEIEKYLKKHPESKLVFQPGTFQINLGPEKIPYFYKKSHIFICNLEEAQKILVTGESDPTKLTTMLKKSGPEIAIVTDGPRGAYATDGMDVWFIPPYPDPKPPYERTGAGDSFASTTVSALALGLSLPIALTWGAINSMSVVQKIGAQEGLLNRHEIEDFLEKAPATFRAILVKK